MLQVYPLVTASRQPDQSKIDPLHLQQIRLNSSPSFPAAYPGNWNAFALPSTILPIPRYQIDGPLSFPEKLLRGFIRNRRRGKISRSSIYVSVTSGNLSTIFLARKYRPSFLSTGVRTSATHTPFSAAAKFSENTTNGILLL